MSTRHPLTILRPTTLEASLPIQRTGELTGLTWSDYKRACDEIIAAFGKGRLVPDIGPDDFASLRNKMARKWGPHRLSKTIQFVHCVFKHGFDADRPLGTSIFA